MSTKHATPSTPLSSSTMVIPDDFMAALQQNAVAHAFYATLKRQSLFTIYHRLHSSKRMDARSLSQKPLDKAQI